MRDRRDRRLAARSLVITCATLACVQLHVVKTATAGERQFVVMLADSPKEGNAQTTDLINPEVVRKAYFDRIDPAIDSFAEYWEEISYGDVTISGIVTDWIKLPWRITKGAGTEGFVDLNMNETYQYGAGERFDNNRGMIAFDLQPPLPPFLSPGGQDVVPGTESPADPGQSIWMPGERFIDMDGDGAWDALDEARNSVDFFSKRCTEEEPAKLCVLDSDCDQTIPLNTCELVTGEVSPDGRPDLLGPWVDLDEDGVPTNTAGCLYMPDDDNDGNPNCCPEGPASIGCEAFPAEGACPPRQWVGLNGNEFIDCNGNLVPDACDISCFSAACRALGGLEQWPTCGGSSDRLPLSSSATDCDVETGDTVPDECQFTMSGEDCVATAPDGDSGDPCVGVPECTSLPIEDAERSLAQLSLRCEFHDSNDSGTLDIVEPFENFLLKWDPEAGASGNGEWVVVDDEYVVNNYPGHADRLLARATSRPIYAEHDPERLASSMCFCSDGSACQSVTVTIDGEEIDIAEACQVGEHTQFNPPDLWTEIGSSKMQADDFVIQEAPVTPEPSWYKQAWVDRYGTEAPAWGGPTRRMVPLPLSGRRCFFATHGGVNGDGTGWVGCGANDPRVVFATSLSCDVANPIPNAFDVTCNFRILPEEVNGLGAPLILYDGPVEHDDLPSSKYHRAGDQKLGEVTSPFNQDIWGEDRGTHDPGNIGGSDDIIPAAGPYATHIHGNFGRDAGNLLHMELLTWRTEPPFNNGRAWLSLGSRTQPLVELFGFRDFNLDGVLDQGEIRNDGSDNYVTAPDGTGNGTGTAYPWNRRRLVEDCMEILDDVIDFDDFVDPVAMDRVTCGTGPLTTSIPVPLRGAPGDSSVVEASGVLSGIVLLSAGGGQGRFPTAPSFFPIHNEDGLADTRFPDTDLPRDTQTPELLKECTEEPGKVCANASDCDLSVPRNKCGEVDFLPQISWNMFVHDLVTCLDCSSRFASDQTVNPTDIQTAFAAHEYLHTWEGFPDLYDYDVFDNGPVVNCPIGRWDIMAGGGLVHPAPILKASPCTDWIKPIDLATILTPGVDAVVTMPPVESVRDESYFFLQNDKRPRERLWFWSAGNGFDLRLPGAGMLIQHTDVFSNFDAVPQQQRSSDRPGFVMVQGDGNEDLQACSADGNRGDAGDPWPGSSDARQFNHNTVPPADWFSANSWTGIDILDVIPDGAGSVQLKINWVPTSIPSLRFESPPAGQTVGSNLTLSFDVSDVFGGTTVKLFYIHNQRTCSATGLPCSRTLDCPLLPTEPNFCRHDVNPLTASVIGEQPKVNPGTKTMTQTWNISSVPDGRYVLFAKLIPGQGADGTEEKFTTPRAGRNNEGDGSLVVTNVAIDTDNADSDDTSRSETWTAVATDPLGQTWRVNSTLTQPVLDEDNPNGDPYPKAATGSEYQSIGGEVRFTIAAGDVPFRMGDSFSFTTTGYTAVSSSLTIAGGRVTVNPVAVIQAAPLAGDPPLLVTFNAFGSFGPNGEELSYEWDFGDASPVQSGVEVSHVFVVPRKFTVRLKVTNDAGRIGEAQVDIAVTNNSPQALVIATPRSGSAPLLVQFNGEGSSDPEGQPLTYVWDYGDGKGANAAREPGPAFATVEHAYLNDAAGVPCTPSHTCEFVATLTVIDEGGKENSDSVVIRVGNSDPIASVTVSPSGGTAPLTVEFDASTSQDPDGDSFTVEWDFGDGSATEMGLRVTHTYTDPGTFRPTATLTDTNGGVGTWTGVSIDVTVNQPPAAQFTVRPTSRRAFVGEEFTFDGAASTDPDGPIDSYEWDFGDGSEKRSGVVVTHAFTAVAPDGVQVTLTVKDEGGLSNTASVTVMVLPNPDNRPPVAHISTLPSACTDPCPLNLDASLSFDPDGDDLTFTWRIFLLENDVPVLKDSFAGMTRQREFTTPGRYQIELLADDQKGGIGRDGPVSLVVSEQIEPEPGQDVPPVDGGGIPDSANQRPLPTLCGLGMVMSLAGSLLGLWAMGLTRRRFR